MIQNAMSNYKIAIYSLSNPRFGINLFTYKGFILKKGCNGF